MNKCYSLYYRVALAKKNKEIPSRSSAFWFVGWRLRWRLLLLWNLLIKCSKFKLMQNSNSNDAKAGQATIEATALLAEVPDMLFTHDYARSITNQIVIYIEYIDGLPHSVQTMFFVETATKPYWRVCTFDFETDCKECELFMFYNSGSGGSPKELQAPHFIDGANASYWMHSKAKFKGKTKAINAVRLDKLIEFNGNPNPFENGREIYGQDYCKFCEKWYDEDACPEHHVINDNGELEYMDGSKASD